MWYFFYLELSSSINCGFLLQDQRSLNSLKLDMYLCFKASIHNENFKLRENKKFQAMKNSEIFWNNVWWMGRYKTVREHILPAV